MIIRRAVYDDLEAIDDIYNQAIATRMATADTVPYTRDERDAWFSLHQGDRYSLFVSEGVEGDTGYSPFSPYRPRRVALDGVAEISYFVHEDHRGRGIGSRLLEFGIAVAPDHGFKHLVAILLGHNEASIGLLKKFGFSEWGRLPGVARFGDEVFDHLYFGLTYKANS